MATDREALTMALACIRWLAFGERRISEWNGSPPKTSDTIQALRAALAAPPVEQQAAPLTLADAAKTFPDGPFGAPCIAQAAQPAAQAAPVANLQTLHDLLYTVQRLGGSAQAQAITEARIHLSGLMSATPPAPTAPAPPAPGCPHCEGEGLADIYVADIRTLSGPARRAYAGVELKKDGSIKMVTRDKEAARAMLAKFAGVADDSLKVSGVLGLTPVQQMSPEEAAAVARALENKI